MRLPQLPLRRIRTRARDRRTGVSVPPSARVQTTSGSRTHNTAPNLAVHCVAKTVHVPMSPWARAPRCGTRPAAPHRVDHEPSADEPASRLAQRPPTDDGARTTGDHGQPRPLFLHTISIFRVCSPADHGEPSGEPTRQRGTYAARGAIPSDTRSILRCRLRRQRVDLTIPLICPNLLGLRTSKTPNDALEREARHEPRHFQG